MCIEPTTFIPLKYHPSEFIPPPISAVSVLPEAQFYLIKLATHDHQALFGEMAAGHFCLNSLGQIAVDEWMGATKAHQAIAIDQWAIYPDYLQGIVKVLPVCGGRDYIHGASRKPRLLSSFVAGYKAAAAKRINLCRDSWGQPVWQRSYHERPLTDDSSRQQIRQMLTQSAAV